MNHVIREADPAHPPAGTLLLLHGRGADEHDLLGLLDVLDPERRCRGITLGAPIVSGDPAHPGRHWYVVSRVGFPDPDTFRRTYDELTSFVDDELGLDWPTTVVGGFSQGGVMAYALGLGAGRPVPAGIMALSSFVPVVDGWAPDLGSRPGVEVAHVHGTADPVIGVDFGRRARALLEAGGAHLLYREFPGGHHVDPRLLGELAAWLRERLPAPAGG
ncbi:MAG TPA: phospholipase [Solirubrobacteraceae bacterium]|jgi:phospholipase/carboxylesterase|nr:phospholipase [Solirubrobacteraceae bacterium]